MIPVTHVFEWANIADKVRRNLFMEFAEVGAKHLVLTCEMIMNCIQKNPYINIYRKDMADAGLTFNDAHAPFGVWDDLDLPIEELRPLMLNRHKLSLQICDLLDVRTCTIHIGNGDLAFGELNKVDILWECVRRSLEELLPVAEKYNVVICIENIWSPVNTPERLLALIDAFKSPYLGICYDSGHANISTCKRDVENNAERQWAKFGLTPVWDDKILEKLQPHIVNCHLHDNHGVVDEHLMPGLGNIDWKKTMGLLKSAPRIQVIQNEVLSGTRQYSIRERVKCFDDLMERF